MILTCNIRNTHYALTEEEVETLKADDRVEDVENLNKIPDIEPHGRQTGNFNKTNSSPDSINWGPMVEPNFFEIM